MKKLLHPCLAAIALTLTANASASSPTPSIAEILRNSRDSISRIRTATYDIEEKYYAEPSDSFCMKTTNYKVIECENPSDSVKLSKSVTLNPDGTFYSGFDGQRRYWARNDHYETSTPRNMWDARRITPPFFNHALSLCDYLLRPNDKVSMTVTGDGDSWTIDISVREKELLCFHGKAYLLPIAPDVTSLFKLRIDKKTCLPDMLSYLTGNPQVRYDIYCSNLATNPFQPEAFCVTDHVGNLKELDSDSSKDHDRKQMNEHFKKLSTMTVPADTLLTSDGSTFSLAHCKDGGLTFLLLTSANCGVCNFAYKTINGLAEAYKDKGVEFAAVMLESSADLRALAEYREKHAMQYPLARNNGSFYQFFIPSGLAPAVFLIDSKGLIAGIHIGFKAWQPEDTEKSYRKMIDKALARQQPGQAPQQ